jgi:hypothetical protein
MLCVSFFTQNWIQLIIFSPLFDYTSYWESFFDKGAPYNDWVDIPQNTVPAAVSLTCYTIVSIFISQMFKYDFLRYGFMCAIQIKNSIHNLILILLMKEGKKKFVMLYSLLLCPFLL